MDSQAIATGHADPHDVHDEAHPAYLRHHFVTVGQQRETASFGMWLFLLTEIMFFGGLFMAYLLYPQLVLRRLCGRQQHAWASAWEPPTRRC